MINNLSTKLLKTIKGHFVLNQKFKLTLLVTQYLSELLYMSVYIYLRMQPSNKFRSSIYTYKEHVWVCDLLFIADFNFCYSILSLIIISV